MKWQPIDAFPEKSKDIYGQRRERARNLITEIYNSGAEIAAIEDTDNEYPSLMRMRVVFDEEARRVRRKLGFEITFSVRKDKLYVQIVRPDDRKESE